MKISSGNRAGTANKGSRVPASGAFSLVEVVLALGICAVAVLPVVGLLPMALQSAREATETTQEAKIIQRVANELIQTPFAQLASQLKGGTPFSRQFNYDGFEVAATGDVYYQVAATLDDFSLPGASDPSTNIYRVGIHIAARGRSELRTMAITVADTGY